MSSSALSELAIGAGVGFVVGLVSVKVGKEAAGVIGAGILVFQVLIVHSFN